MPLPIEQSCYWLATGRRERVNRSLETSKRTLRLSVQDLPGSGRRTFFGNSTPNLMLSSSNKALPATAAAGATPASLAFALIIQHELAATHFGQEEAERLAKLGLRNIEDLPPSPAMTVTLSAPASFTLRSHRRRSRRAGR